MANTETLTHLDLSRNRLAAKTAAALAAALQQQAGAAAVPSAGAQSAGAAPGGLERLNLAWNQMEGSAAGVQALLGAVGVAGVRLTSLDLSWNRVGDAGAVALGEALRRSEAGGRLQWLNLERCAVGEGACVVMAALVGRHAGLRGLNLSGNPIGSHGVRALFRLAIARQGLEAPPAQCYTQGPPTTETPPLPAPQLRRAGATGGADAGGGGESVRGGAEGEWQGLRVWARDCSLAASTRLLLRVLRPDGRCRASVFCVLCLS